jgi:hypothetical protein
MPLICNPLRWKRSMTFPARPRCKPDGLMMIKDFSIDDQVVLRSRSVKRCDLYGVTRGNRYPKFTHFSQIIEISGV